MAFLSETTSCQGRRIMYGKWVHSPDLYDSMSYHTHCQSIIERKGVRGCDSFLKHAKRKGNNNSQINKPIPLQQAVAVPASLVLDESINGHQTLSA